MNSTEPCLYNRLLALGIALFLTGCGSQSPNQTTNPPPPTPVTITLSSSTVTLQAGAQQQFSAVVKGTSNTAVSWSVDGKAGGDSSVGTLSATGMYTAPSQAGTHTVTATSQADTTKSANAQVTVQIPVTPPPSVSVSPGTSELGLGATQQFIATVQNVTNPSLTWSVDGVAGGNASLGTITSQGLYTAPSQVGTHTVTVSLASSSTSASSAVTVFSLAVSPATAGLGTGTTQQFSALVQGLSDASLTWSVDGVAGGNATVGTVTAQGFYTAPSQVGAHTVTVTVASTSASATSSVSVFSITVTPDTALVAPSATQQFTATILGLSDNGVAWAVDGTAGGNSSVGTINASGLYTAPKAIGSHTVTASSVAYPTVDAATQAIVVNIAQSAVLTYHNDDTRDGAYTEEVTLMPSNVNSTQFGKLVSYPVDGQIYAQPLYIPQLAINGGTHSVVFVETQNNSVYAFDADANSSNPTTFWQRNLGPPVGAYDAGGPWPTVGILSTPVIDATTNTMYFVSHIAGLSPEYWLYAVDVTTGADKVKPVGISGTYSGESLGPGCYQRMGLALDPVTNWIYLAFGSCPNGWIFAYDKSSLSQKAVLEDTNGAAGGAFWSSGGAPAIDDKTGNVYLMSGTDAGDEAWISPPPNYTQTGYNDAFLNLNPSTLDVQSYFSPDDNYTLATNDADLGSGSNILVPGNSSTPLETLGGGKDGNIFVLNPLSMGGFSGSNNVLQTLHIGTQQYNNIFSTPVYWNGNIYFHSNQDVLRAFSWTAGAGAGQQLSTSPTSSGQTVFSMHGATASISANGNNNGIIWEIDNSNYVGTNPTASGPSVLHAYDATNLATELYNSAQDSSRDQAGQALKFTVPTIANGRVFVPTATELDIYGELGK